MHTSFFLKVLRIVILLLIFSYCRQLQAQLTYKELAIQYDSAWAYKKLQLIPVRFKEQGNGTPGERIKAFNEGVLSFSEASRRQKVVVKENTTNGGADVSSLLVKNRSKDNILLLSGELLQGGKQDRAIGETTLIPAGKRKNYVSAFCIERGRWDDKPKSFKHAGTADAKVRKQIDVAQRQGRVWKAIDTALISKKKKNNTYAYLEAYNDTTDLDTSYLRFFINKMKQSDSSYAGFIAVTGNRIINAEIFSGTDVCLAAYVEMIKSYMHSLTKSDGAPNKTREEIETFTDNFLKNTAQQKKYLLTHGRIYYYKEAILHLIAYD